MMIYANDRDSKRTKKLWIGNYDEINYDKRIVLCDLENNYGQYWVHYFRFDVLLMGHTYA